MLSASVLAPALLKAKRACRCRRAGGSNGSKVLSPLRGRMPEREPQRAVGLRGPRQATGILTVLPARGLRAGERYPRLNIGRIALILSPFSLPPGCYRTLLFAIDTDPGSRLDT